LRARKPQRSRVLNEPEVLDLLAYTLSRDYENGPRFKKE